MKISLFIILTLFISEAILAKENLIVNKQKRYNIENKQINESSGLACSTHNKKILWTHNDSGHMPIIYALSQKGKDRGTFYLDDMDSYDWEDMDAFVYQDKHYLLIADTGDNIKMRWDYRLYIIEEPKLNSAKKNASRSSISPAWTITFKYDDNQSHDVEAVAVDISREKILLLTKRTKQSILFELDLKPSNLDRTQVAIKVGELKQIKRPSALDISLDGKLMSVHTYARIHRFHYSSKKNQWKYDNSLKYKGLYQPEAMCLREDEKYYFVSSEKKSKLLKINAN
ncbi:hypothetical protein [sulfur-oxidizing endosymbiont of Gigantopelta aegis]|uniref:hypothetical protein n=1 Tax=sulfur-oxidizing endosymbiont of Gigantopelta aegis TaxID=2794934 RepID=UPI0018DE3E6A|nr:hypothetical protein [sulfur-oxidizing endosymbiont of Gigantopelta aegis]